MKRIITLIFINIFILFIYFNINANADSTDYNTFSEVMMSSGKLICNFTEEEIKELYSNLGGNKFFGVTVYIENQNVDASYISNTLYSVENKSSTDIEYTFYVEVETVNKVSFSANSSLSGKAAGTFSGIKGEIGAKCGVEVSAQTTLSKKEKKNMNLVVEAGSRAIVYLTGNLSVTNGCAAVYEFWFRVAEGCFEIVTLKNQYARVEKSLI